MIRRYTGLHTVYYNEIKREDESELYLSNSARGKIDWQTRSKSSLPRNAFNKDITLAEGEKEEEERKKTKRRRRRRRRRGRKKKRMKRMKKKKKKKTRKEKKKKYCIWFTCWFLALG